MAKLRKNASEFLEFKAQVANNVALLHGELIKSVTFDRPKNRVRVTLLKLRDLAEFALADLEKL